MTVACDCLGEDHANSVLRSQDDHRARFDRLAWNYLKIVSSEQIAQNHEDLQHRILIADTDPRSASEGQIGEGRAQLLVRLGETLGVERLRILPVARCMVRAINIDNDRRSSGYVDALYVVVRDGLAVDHPERRVEAERLLNDLSGEFELGNVRVTQRRVAQHGIELLPYPFETLRMRTQEVEKPRETIRRC